LCALPLADEHPHLLDRDPHGIVCACDACATLFELIEVQRYRRIRPAVRRLAGVIDDATWSALGVPVGLAFLSLVPGGEVMAAYPGPAGATVAAVDRAAWNVLVERHPGLQNLEPEIEAWLVNRMASEPLQYRVSIDYCYRLAGLVRSRWSGVGGGQAVAQSISEFFRMLDERAA
jgi:hypothetical protein